jgi:hypothetical protein
LGGPGWPAGAVRLEELLAYAGSRYPPKVHIHVQIRIPRALASPYSGDAALVVVASIAAATSYSTISTDFNTSVIVISCLVLGTLAVLRLVPRVPSKPAIVVALLIGLIPQLWRPPIGNVELGRLFHLSTGLAMLAGALLVAAVLVARRRWGLGMLAFASMAVALVLVVQASGHPAIDVWIILQQSTRALLHGANPYELSFSGVPAGQTNDCFNYLPFTFLASLPGRVALGDVRYAELAVLLGGVAMLVRSVRRAGRLAAAAERVPAAAAEASTLAVPLVVMALCLPGTLRVVQQSWNESMILGCLAAAVALVLSGREWLAVVPLGLALMTKQHVVLVLPLWALWRSFGPRRALAAAGLGAAVCLPWALANPSRFYGCTVRFFLDLPARQDSLSVWKFVPGGLQTLVVLALTAGGYLLAYRLLDGSASSLVFGCGLLFAAFDLANKQSFENQWLLACQLLVLGVACRAAEGAATPGAGTPGAGAERAGAEPHFAAGQAPPPTDARHPPAFRHEGADVP